MRTPRVAILVFSLAASLFIVFRAVTASRTTVVAAYPPASATSKSVFSFMYYNTPFSLFPPNAAISLTDDNSTSFAARPAAFGPKLASSGLSGQLWVGSGFGEDSLDGDGELGCSDLPGWGSSNTRASLKNSFKVGSTRVTSAKLKMPKTGASLLDHDSHGVVAKGKPESRSPKNDNTDNYLTEEVAGTPSRRDGSIGSSGHADIQSIQEAAEIEGKIVLLKRGGCGFLEKVMWAQRRGAIAVIVGDNQRGGPLIQMFAHGEDVDNVTVPSVFTAWTTAQLLSSLTQPGSFIEDTLDDNGKPALKVQQTPAATHKKQSQAKPKAAASNGAKGSKSKRLVHEKRVKSAKSGWGLGGLFSRDIATRAVDSQSRPPRSGRLDWVLVDEFNDEKDKLISDTLGKAKKPKSNKDDFVIGVHDWRDPDLVRAVGQKNTVEGAPAAKNAGSGKSKDGDASSDRRPKAAEADSKHHGFLSTLFGSDSGDTAQSAGSSADKDEDSPITPSSTDSPQPHEGLWVTITPTSSASPFFDTLLVLVISPLVTLTVVYALLILRARIRRRRWRAPKSVVDQLPVRTYHTVVSSSPSLPPRVPSPSAATPTTPLLQHSPLRPRPRSRTTTGVIESENLLSASGPVPTPPSPQTSRRSEFEKGAGGFSAEWRKYMGRQVECVVCLEEYVDGVSRVMSLPCGHEFHVDCITPWLTTRRRTCPICKGDVVRSLARGKGNGPRYDAYREDSDDDDEDEDEAEASGSGSADRQSDLEQGVPSSEPRNAPQRRDRDGGWLGVLSNSFHGRTRPRPRSPSPEDRSR
ncbi:RING-9 protein [Metarhizium album ARSEF 1941]|uniref:RING-type E3 ubiquitin transferase n=1 Tax=Metarhizium album (strain ARSEF 1941) TaxID=1081103 RepID=A0A0B2X191_METAS|nr:RING-9 protein [Metarhizium album ARSEF 1941]KHN98835.1 RING-9 protein [Metarhizium album ARSEF 1941]